MYGKPLCGSDERADFNVAKSLLAAPTGKCSHYTSEYDIMYRHFFFSYIH